MIMPVTVITQSGQTIKAGTQVPTRANTNSLGETLTKVLHEDWWQRFEVTKPMTWQDQVVNTVFTPLE
jgi:hypothetical protein